MKRLFALAALCLVGTFGILVPTANATSKSALAPKIEAVQLEPSEFTDAGGHLDFVARLARAQTCHVNGPFVYRVVRCSSEHLAITERVPPNTSGHTLRFSATLTVRNGHGGAASKFLWITESATSSYAASSTTSGTTPIVVPTTTTTTTIVAQPTPPVVNLDQCTAGPNCYYGPIYNTYQTYGNASPAVLGDCTFAAAANWMQIVLNITPDPSLIGYEFAEAGGSTTAGLAQSALWTYWETYGIDGVVLTGLHPYYTDQTDVQNGVRDYGAMIIELSFAAGTYFGNIQIPTAGDHDAVVDGFTPAGPLVVSWGQTIQLTWQQWTAEVIGMWGIGAG